MAVITPKSHCNGPRQHPFWVPWEECGTDDPLNECEEIEAYLDEDDDRPRGKGRQTSRDLLDWQWPVELEGEVGVDRLSEE